MPTRTKDRPTGIGCRTQPIVYGRETLAPLPGLALAYEPVDWDGDGLTDILALERRGGGLKLYRNVGEFGEAVVHGAAALAAADGPGGVRRLPVVRPR